MHTIEFASTNYLRGKKFLLGIILTPKEFENDFTEIQTAVIEWRKLRRNLLLCGGISITMMTSESECENVTNFFENALNNCPSDTDLGKLPITLYLMEGSKNIKRVHFHDGIETKPTA